MPSPADHSQVKGPKMRMAMTTALLLSLAVAGCQQQQTTTASPQAPSRGGFNVGSLTCNVAGGVGFVFGSSRTLNCLFTRTDGTAERYEGTIRRYGVDVGFTRDSTIVWMVFA